MLLYRVREVVDARHGAMASVDELHAAPLLQVEDTHSGLGQCTVALGHKCPVRAFLFSRLCNLFSYGSLFVCPPKTSVKFATCRNKY